MKSIELTKEHKSKLLEMCKTLFPEWHEHCVEIDGNNKTIIMFTNYVGGSEWGQIIIHWFEFCIIHLLPKFNFEPNILLNSDLKNKHLIDYLYEQFKKIKL